MTCPNFVLADPVFLLAFLRRFFFAIVGALSVVLVDERLFFSAELLVAVVLMLFRAKVLVVVPFLRVTFEVTGALKATAHQPYFARRDASVSRAAARAAACWARVLCRRARRSFTRLGTSRCSMRLTV